MMKDFLVSISPKAVIFAAALASASPAFAQTVVGRNSAVKGNVTLQSIDEDVRVAVIKDDVRLGDAVESSVESSLQVLLLDETVFTVGPSASITIDEFVYNPNSDNNRLTAQVKRGMFRFMSGNISREAPDNVQISTPVATLGVRGTILEGLVGADAIAFAEANGLVDPNRPVDPDAATLFVLRGPGPQKTGSDREGSIDIRTSGGTTRLNRPGDSAFIQSIDMEPETFDMTEAGFEFFSDRLRTEPTQQPSFQPFVVPLKEPETNEFQVEPLDEPEAEDPVDPVADIDWPEEPDVFDESCPVFCDDE